MLAAELVMIGKRSSAKKRASRDELEGSCETATHFVRAATVGAFAVASGSKADIGGSAKIMGKGAGASSSSATKIEAQDGDIGACEKSTPDSTTPPAQCGAVLRVELEPIGANASARGDTAPELAVAACPKGFAMSDGACRRLDVPHQCTPGDAGDCDKQCSAGDAASCATLAVMYRDGLAVSKDWAKAATLAEQACNKDVLAGCRVLAAARLAGQGVKKDKPGGVALLDKACRGGDGLGCVDLGVAKLADKKLANDAQYAFRRACYGGGEFEGSAWLGPLYAEGLGGQKASPKIAMKFFEKGCKEGSARACAGQAALTQNKAEAKQLYERACNMGDAKACKKK
jgi:TPR repeat protein